MTKLNLANRMVKKYMPSKIFNNTEPSECHHIQSHIEVTLRFEFADPETSFEDMVYSPEAFLYFWGQLWFECPTDICFSSLKNGLKRCQISAHVGRGDYIIESFYRAVMAWEEER